MAFILVWFGSWLAERGGKLALVIGSLIAIVLVSRQLFEIFKPDMGQKKAREKATYGLLLKK